MSTFGLFLMKIIDKEGKKEAKLDLLLSFGVNCSQVLHPNGISILLREFWKNVCHAFLANIKVSKIERRAGEKPIHPQYKNSHAKLDKRGKSD